MSPAGEEPPPAMARFLASLELDYDRWREGEGYDLEALRALTPSEQEVALALLRERLGGPGAGWREVEAVAALALPAAMRFLRELEWHDVAEIRLRAAVLAPDGGSRGTVEREVLRLLRDPATDIGADALMRHAGEHPEPAIRAALLWCAVDGAPHLRVHAAALALYLAGGARSAFDWEHRPLFLRFGEPPRAERQAALAELLGRMERGSPPG